MLAPFSPVTLSFLEGPAHRIDRDEQDHPDGSGSVAASAAAEAGGPRARQGKKTPSLVRLDIGSAYDLKRDTGCLPIHYICVGQLIGTDMLDNADVARNLPRW